LTRRAARIAVRASEHSLETAAARPRLESIDGHAAGVELNRRKRVKSKTVRAVASQKLTWPVVTATPPDTTDAVKLTMVPELTLVTALPADVTVGWVVLTLGVCAHSVDCSQKLAIAMANRRTRKWTERLRAKPPLEKLAVRLEEHERDLSSK
jgi:hypothetical protein